VPCTQPHDAEVFAIAPLPGQELPAEAELDRLSVEVCTAGFRSYVGVAPHDSPLDFSWWAPTKEAWASGDRMVVCALEYPDHRRLVGSMLDTAVKTAQELRTVKVGQTVIAGSHSKSTGRQASWPTHPNGPPKRTNAAGSSPVRRDTSAPRPWG
jgi:hypothetical protein